MTPRRHLALVALLAAANAPAAHDGPPYPIADGEPFGDYVLSVWADPDVGIGTFYFYVEPEPAQRGDLEIRIAVEPVDGGVPGSEFSSRPADEDEPYELIGEAAFDYRGDWHVRFSAEDAGGPAELPLVVEVTPPGSLGWFDIVWFLSPFLALGFLWIRAMTRRREFERAAAR